MEKEERAKEIGQDWREKAQRARKEGGREREEEAETPQNQEQTQRQEEKIQDPSRWGGQDHLL